MDKTIGNPYIFDEYFASGKEETLSPFLKPSSRKWAENLPIKLSLISAFCLVCAFGFSRVNPPISNLFLAFVYFISGTPALIDAVEDLLNLEINIDVLMTVAALLSVVIDSAMEGGLLLVLFEFSGALEKVVSNKTKSALMALNKLTPSQARIIDDEGHINEVAVSQVVVGQNIVIPAGENIPLDGKVIAGQTSVDFSHLTGESMPVAVSIGDDVHAGGQNLDGSITVEVTKLSRDSAVAKIIDLVTKAHSSKPKTQQFLDKFGKPYATTIILLAFTFAFSFPFLLKMPWFSTEGSVYRALTFLIAASPCALIIATPTAYLSSLSACAKSGILLKGGVVLDALSQVKSVAFDKTGTLTTGKLVCTSIEKISGSDRTIDEKIAIQVAAGLEARAKHPIATAITAHAKEKKLRGKTIDQFKSIPGYGLQGNVTIGDHNHAAYIGNVHFIEKVTEGKNTTLQNGLNQLEKQEGKMIALLLIDQSLFLFHFSDALRANLSELFSSLRKEHNLHLTMLSGDTQENAKRVAKEVGLDSYHAHLKPEDKYQQVMELRKKSPLAMVGDGINDAPALAAAHVGIAMGKVGSAAAIQESDVIFLRDDIKYLSWLMGQSKKTLRIIKQNITIAICVIFLATTPALLGFVPLWLAVILHEGGTVIVGLNSLRLLRGAKKK